ncbi:MAG: glycosyltransferase [Syntrophomonas sp.]|nr:glycosyltransferase [Syntrophomonas sp.]
MEQKPLVSIIIPTLNEARKIEGLLQELQFLFGIEIIISDGGSTDDTLKICANYPVKVYTGTAGRGIQLNIGAQAARADILLFLHADCHISTEIIQQLSDAVGQGRMWGCAQINFDDPAFFFKCLAFISNWRARVLSSCYGDQAIFCQKDFFYRNGKFPEMVFLEDLAFSHIARR